MRVSEQNYSLLAQMGRLIQLKRNELTVLEQSMAAIQQKAIVDAGGDPSKQYIRPDGFIIEYPKSIRPSRSDRILRLVPTNSDDLEESPTPS